MFPEEVVQAAEEESRGSMIKDEDLSMKEEHTSEVEQPVELSDWRPEEPEVVQAVEESTGRDAR